MAKAKDPHKKWRESRTKNAIEKAAKGKGSKTERDIKTTRIKKRAEKRKKQRGY